MFRAPFASSEARPEARPGAPTAEDARLRALSEEHFQFIWRSLRRLGVPESAVDDATQRVFEVATVKISHIREGSERAFLFSTAIRIAAGMRRHHATHREILGDELLDGQIDPALPPDEATELKRRRELLDGVLAAMPLDLRAVFVLFELEGLATWEIAALLGIPPGTAASRLRRAREHFHDQARRLQARRAFAGGRP